MVSCLFPYLNLIAISYNFYISSLLYFLYFEMKRSRLIYRHIRLIALFLFHSTRHVYSFNFPHGFTTIDRNAFDGKHARRTSPTRKEARVRGERGETKRCESDKSAESVDQGRPVTRLPGSPRDRMRKRRRSRDSRRRPRCGKTVTVTEVRYRNSPTASRNRRDSCACVRGCVCCQSARDQ